MSTLNTTPVMFCRVCGKPLVLQAATFVSDPTGELLDLFVKTAGDYALCDYHAAQRAWYIQQGRIEDWENGRP